jgi:hypothetical protein
MALFTDTDVASLAAMRSLDNEVAAVAENASRGRNSSEIVLSGTPDSITSQAWSECRSKLEASLVSFSTYIGSPGMQAHIAAVMNTGSNWGGFGTRAQIRLSQIVVSDTYYANSLSPIERWVTYTALRLAFQELSNRLGGNDKIDRFEIKRQRYDTEARRVWQQIVAQGLPIVQCFFDAPGSIHAYNAGIWGPSCVSQTPDPNNTNADDQSIRIAITYVDADYYSSPTDKRNAESGPSQILTSILPASTLLNFNIATLNPPNMATPPPTGLSQPFAPFHTASHWQIYAGPAAPNLPLYLQVPMIPISQQSATLPATLLTTGPILDKGQHPSSNGGNLIFANAVTRG